ncbi:multicopper redoxase [Collybia nuda]|uniref:Multicopper redoxase n=1 Tax=Collybia nuda TaxID=64659 RepID=A0A9P5XYQ2_9AGAR|nr:multicopper redoxase [Collybia nuda]
MAPLSFFSLIMSPTLANLVSVPVLALALSFLGVTEAAIGPVAELEIVNRDISPDGFKRSTVLAGGTFPGPLITATKGERLNFKIMNALTDPTMLRSTSIHWHGIYQKGTNWADGTAFVTQCPIAANDSFVYDFSTVKQSGTYWYHSHLSTQYCDGLRGALVIYDPDDPHKDLYDVDDESTVITLADWYHVPARSIGFVPPTAVATLINGKGRYGFGPNVALSVINVQRGKRYRFRLIGMSCEPNFTFSIDNHTMAIIEADGENTVPLEVDSIQIHAGQRYSVVVTANQDVGNYWVRANPRPPLGISGFDGGRNSAILRYVGAPEAEPSFVPFPPSSVKPMREVDIHALTDAAAPGLPHPGGADVVLNILPGFDPLTLKFTMNGRSFVPPSMPALLQIISGAKAAQELMPKGSYYELPRGKVVELSLPGTNFLGGEPHPFHLHGHSFSVIRSADSSTYNFENPVRRDTVSAGLEGSNATIRFVTDNAGPWFLHCHIDWHLELGLAVVFAEDIPNAVKENPVPEAWENLCPRYDSLKPDQL